MKFKTVSLSLIVIVLLAIYLVFSRFSKDSEGLHLIDSVDMEHYQININGNANMFLQYHPFSTEEVYSIIGQWVVKENTIETISWSYKKKGPLGTYTTQYEVRGFPYNTEIRNTDISTGDQNIWIRMSLDNLIHEIIDEMNGTQQGDSDADLTSANFHSGVGGYAALSTPAFQLADAVR